MSSSGASAENNAAADGENTCVVCFKTVEFYSIGICDHPVCYECSTRMRVLCKQKECPICRREMPEVVFSREIRHYLQLKPNPNLYDDQYGLVFCSRSIQDAYFNLLAISCNKCHRVFRHFQQLKDHMRKEHELFYCELCVDNLKIFPFERKCYNRVDLATHRRKGDEDNKSHRGHPLCEFCDRRYMDNDELFRHLRRDHLFCHFCDADGKHQYYSSYEQMREHFRQEHYLCEEGDCKNEQFTSVFRTDIDLKAHNASVHSRQLGRAASKQARTLEFEFNFAPRSRMTADGDKRSRRPLNPKPPDDEELDGAVGYHQMDPGGGNSIAQMNFPSLGSNNISQDNDSKKTTTSTTTFTSKLTANFNGDDFPSLGGGGGGSISNLNMLSNVKVKKNEDFPKLGPPRNPVPKNASNDACNNKSNLNYSKGIGKPSTSTVKLTLNHDRPPTRSNVSIHVNNHNGTTAVTTRISSAPTTTMTGPSKPKSEAFPVLGAQNVPKPAEWVVAKSRKHPEPKKVAPAPSLPPSSLDDFPTLSSSSSGMKKLVKKSSITVPVEDWWTKTHDNNKPAVKTNKKESVANSNGNKSANNNNSGKVTNNESNKSSNAKSAKSKSKKSNNNNLNVDVVANSNALNANNANNDGNEVNKKLSKLEIECDNNDADAEFKKHPPPPGISVKPPPGFNCLSSNDLTFTNSSGQSYAIIPQNSATYVPPGRFASRNSNLIGSFIAHLETKEKLNEFKNYSDLFRKGLYSGEKFYEHCRCILGDKFDKIFPELLVLLPDIAKQQELYVVHKQRGDCRSLEECATCKQIVFGNELKQHLNAHYMENHFPNLQTVDNNNKAWEKN